MLDELLRGLEESPHDDEQRRVLADYLIENGEPAWGEMLVLAAARSEEAANHARINEVTWKRILKGLVHHIAWADGGFHISIRWDYVDKLGRVLAMLPIRTVKLLRFGTTWTDAKLRAIADAPALQHVQHLVFGQFFDGDVAPMFGAPHRFTHLRSLVFDHERIDAESLKLLGSYPWKHLDLLDLGDYYEPGAVGALLADAPHVKRIAFATRLDDTDLRAIAGAPHVVLPTVLRLDTITAAGVAAFARARHFTPHSLTVIAMPELAQLLAAPNLRGLRALQLEHAELASVGVVLAASLPELASLSISNASDAIAIAIAGASLPKLSAVSLRYRIGDAGARAIAGMRLTSISLGDDITDDGALAFANSKLVHLDLSHCRKITKATKSELRKRLGPGVCKFSR